MGIGVWEPKRPVNVDEARLRKYVDLMARADPAKLEGAMTASDITDDAQLMKQAPEAWAVATNLPDADLESLIRFFTLAEMQLVGWDGGKLSPVIPLVKILKDRGAFSAELRKWIKANTDNRYLPHGSAL